MGDWVVEGSAEFEKDTGEDGGAKIDVDWLGNPPARCPSGWFDKELASGLRDAGTTRFPPFCLPKQDIPPQQHPHLFTCQVSKW